MIHRLVGDTRRLFAAGDDDQSIYGFRNAYPIGLRQFGDSYPTADPRELEECHRCDRSILALALSVIEQDVGRIEKNFHALDDAEEGTVSAYRFASARAEARGIARLCQELIESGTSPGEILILLRNDPQGVYSTPIVGELRSLELPAVLAQDPFAVFNRSEPRALICLLRLLDSREDSLAWRELLALRRNGVGGSTFQEVYGFADERGITYATALLQVRDDPDVISGNRRNALAEDVAAIEAILDEAGQLLDEAADEAVAQIIELLDLDSDSEEMEEVQQLVDSLSADGELALSQVVGRIQTARGTYGEVDPTAESAIRLMTMHSAKGLTADAVFIAACEDELIPGGAANQREIDDERRLLYVSLTRARHVLTMSYARRRPGRQSEILQSPEQRTFSSFLTDYVAPMPR